MKKLLALVLVLTLVLGMGVGVFAEEDWSEVPITKKLTSQGTNPAETFHFIVGEGSGERDGKDIPAPGFGQHSTFDITIGEDGLSKSHNLVLPNFTQVGVYTYPIYEAEGTTAGMVYDKGPKDLVITVINNVNHDPDDEDSPKFLRVVTMAGGTEDNPVKVDAFENKFYSGDLTIKKEIKGNYADPNDKFEITVTLTPVEGKVLNSDAIKHDGGDLTVLNEETGAVKIVYKNVIGDDSFTIQNIPYDVTYTVVETDTGVDYIVTYANASGIMGVDSAEDADDAAAKVATITNTRGINVETGINLDNLPYILILGAASVGLVAFTLKRRFSDDR